MNILEQKIGFIGLGIMGRPMVHNLLKHSIEVQVHDIVTRNVEQCVNVGAKASALETIAKTCDVVITMLPNGPQVEEVVLAKDGLAANMREGTLLIDASSIDPGVSKRLAATLKERNIEMLDAPVSGGEPKAVDATLSFMVGGDEAVFAYARPLLALMGSSITLCGPIGAGNTVKLANQIIVACNIQAVCEAFSMAQKAGIDPQKVYMAIKDGLAGSTVMNAKIPMLLDGNKTPGFRIDLHIKDLDNALKCAHTVGAYTPMSAQVQEILKWLAHHGSAKKDHSAIMEFYETQDALTFGRKEEDA